MIVTEPMETIHLYYEQEEPTPPTGGFDGGIVLVSLVCFALLVWRVCSIPPTLETIIVPAHFLPLKRFSATIPIIPTGEKTYPATYAVGVLTVYNGSFLTERIPQGLILTASNGVEVTTDDSVIVPAGNPPAYGIATIVAHAVTNGIRGNIPANAINQIYGSALYIRNLTAFTGGKQSYSMTYTTPQDHVTALSRARAILSRLVPQTMLEHTCKEVLQYAGVYKIIVAWACQYVTFTPPVFFRVVGIEVRGKSIVLYGFPVVRPRSIVVK